MRGFGFNNQATARIQAFAQNTAPVFASDGSNKPSTRPLTANFEEWTETRTFQWRWLNTPDISSLVQEVIDRPSWSAENNLGFRICNPSEPDANWAIADYAQGPYSGNGNTSGNRIELHVTYTLNN